MSRKDYELIAACIHRSRMVKSLERDNKHRLQAIDGIKLVAIDLASTFAADNPNFDRERFMAACGF
jgi:hypothetical protein